MTECKNRDGESTAGDADGENSGQLAFELPVISSGQNILFPGQTTSMIIPVANNPDAQALARLFGEFYKEKSTIALAAQISEQFGVPEFAELVTLGGIISLKTSAGEIELRIVALGRAITIKPYQLYGEDDRKFQSIFSVTVVPIFEPIVTESEWNGMEYVLSRAAIARDVAKLLVAVAHCLEKLYESDQFNEAQKRRFKKMNADLVGVLSALERNAGAADLDEAIYRAYGGMSFGRQLNCLSQNSLFARLQLFHTDITDLIASCDEYLFQDEDDQDRAEEKLSKNKQLLPALHGMVKRRGRPNDLFGEMRTKGLELIQRINAQIADLKQHQEG